MKQFTIRRAFSSLVVLWGVSTLIFFMIHLISGDPAALMLGERATPERIIELRETMGLEDPLYQQYFRFFRKLMQGDLGRSFRTQRLVVAEIKIRVGPTAQLAVVGMGIALLIGVSAGVIAARYRDTWIESAVMMFSMIGISVPNFVLGMFLMLLFSLQQQLPDLRG